MLLTFKYRLRPSKRQHRALESVLESQRQLYNAALQERIDAYEKAGISRSYFDQCGALTEWRQSDAEARALPANLQRYTLKRVDNACLGFLHAMQRGERAVYPRFRARGQFKSFGFRQFSGITMNDTRLRFRGMPGGLRVHMHRPLPDGCPLLECTIGLDPRGWFAAIAVRVPEQPIRPVTRVVGIDLGISHLAALSDGGVIPGLRPGRLGDRRLRVLGRAVARKHRGSSNRAKARMCLARQYAKTARQRAEHLNQASARLVREYDLIAHETLNLRGMLRSTYGRDLYDASWGKLLAMLRYKAERSGARIVEVDARNTTQDCSNCGLIVPKTIRERQHDCPHCGLRIDRDLNAARNVLRRAGVSPGLLNVVECGKRAGGNIDSSESSHFPSVQDQL